MGRKVAVPSRTSRPDLMQSLSEMPIRELMDELEGYRQRTLSRAGDPTLIEMTVARLIKEVTRIVREAGHGRIELRVTDFTANTYREGLLLRNIREIRATNFMPGAWNGPLGEAVISGNCDVLRRGGSVSRLFLLGLEESSRVNDSRLVEADEYVREEIRKLCPKKMKNYWSKCVAAHHGVFRNFFSVDDRVVVETILDPQRRPKSIVIIENPEEVAEFIREFEAMNHLDDIGTEKRNELKYSVPRAQDTQGIFICYRRSEAASITDHIDEKLTEIFPRDKIFHDVESIRGGNAFPEDIRRSIAGSDVFLAIIGNEWLELTDAQGQRRLDDDNDWVRQELEIALENKVPVIPVLVEGAAMPKIGRLPRMLRALADLQSVSIRPKPDFPRDMDRLIHQIRLIIQDRRNQDGRAR
jgi:hypothetical protein